MSYICPSSWTTFCCTFEKTFSNDFSISNELQIFAGLYLHFFGKFSKTKIMHITRLTIMKLIKIILENFFQKLRLMSDSDHCHQKSIFQWNPKCLYINMPVMVQLLKMWLWLVNTYIIIFKISWEKLFFILVF